MPNPCLEQEISFSRPGCWSQVCFAPDGGGFIEHKKQPAGAKMLAGSVIITHYFRQLPEHLQCSPYAMLHLVVTG
jgi:hypothetical protein